MGAFLRVAAMRHTRESRARKEGEEEEMIPSPFSAAFFSFVAGNGRVGRRGPVGELCRVSRLKVGLRRANQLG